MLSLLVSDKALLIIGTVVGMAVCTAGIGPVAAKGEWLHPLSLVGYVLGVAILLVVGAGLFDVRLPVVDSSRAALIVLVILVIAKIALTQLHHAIA